MSTLIVSTPEIINTPSVNYELPPEGISILGYIVRRMHKTKMLLPLQKDIQGADYASVLAQVAFYAVSASSSFGKLHYEPQMDQVGTEITEVDPNTGAVVRASLEQLDENGEGKYVYSAMLPDGGRIEGVERMQSAEFSFEGWRMPGQIEFSYIAPDESYAANLSGTITREILPRLFGPWHMRAHGCMDLHDSEGNTGSVKLERNAKAAATIQSANGRVLRDIDLSL